MPKLTKRVVEAASAAGRDSFIWCDELPGFGLRVFASGKRSYLVQYRAGGRTRRVTIGPHGPITTDEARKEALSLLGKVAKGADPAEERASLRQALTVKELCDAYLEAAGKGLIMGKAGRAKKATTLYADKGRIERHIVPLLGRRLVRDLTRSDVERFIRDVTAGKTATIERTRLRGKAVVEGGAGTAARTAGLLGGILTFAISEGVITSNPMFGVKRPADKRRELRLTPEDYRAVGEALQASEQDAETWQAVAGAWLLVLTGCRLGEIERLRWSEVHRAGMCFRLEDTKEGASVRPVGNPAFYVLEGLERREGCPYVLPAVRGGTSYYGSLPGGWKRIAERAGLSQVTPHTLRHSFASVAADLGFSESTIGALLGHSGGTVTSRYMHHLDSVLIAAADRVARTIYSFMTGEKANLVELATTARQ